MVYDELTPEQLKERLMVAETIMKRLYNRNKELESYHSEQQRDPEAPTQPLPSEELSKIMSNYQLREAELEKDMRLKDEIIMRLERENQRLVKDYSGRLMQTAMDSD